MIAFALLGDKDSVENLQEQYEAGIFDPFDISDSEDDDLLPPEKKHCGGMYLKMRVHVIYISW